MGNFVRVSKITITILILVRGIINNNITTKLYWFTTISIYFIFFVMAFMFCVIVQLKNKRLPFSLNVLLILVPIYIRVSTEYLSVFGFNYDNCWPFVVASRMEILFFKSISLTFVKQIQLQIWHTHHYFKLSIKFRV